MPHLKEVVVPSNYGDIGNFTTILGTDPLISAVRCGWVTFPIKLLRDKLVCQISRYNFVVNLSEMKIVEIRRDIHMYIRKHYCISILYIYVCTYYLI